MSFPVAVSYGGFYSLGYDAKSENLNGRPDLQENSQALGRFLSAVEKRAFRRAQLATGNTDDALDIVQDAMVSLIKRYADKKPEDWELLFQRILSSRIMDWHRRATVRKRFGLWFSSNGNGKSDVEEPGEAEFEDINGRSPEQLSETQQSLNNLEMALQELPLKQQQVFLLRAWEGLSEKETSLAMSCSVGTVKSHYARARSFLRTKLKAQRADR